MRHPIIVGGRGMEDVEVEVNRAQRRWIYGGTLRWQPWCSSIFFPTDDGVVLLFPIFWWDI